MTTAWEITTDDIANVVAAYDKPCNDEQASVLLEGLDDDAIIDNLLNFTKFDAQVASMMSDIEDHLVEIGFISLDGVKKFMSIEDDDCIEDEDEYEDFHW